MDFCRLLFRLLRLELAQLLSDRAPTDREIPECLGVRLPLGDLDTVADRKQIFMGRIPPLPCRSEELWRIDGRPILPGSRRGCYSSWILPNHWDVLQARRTASSVSIRISLPALQS